MKFFELFLQYLAIPSTPGPWLLASLGSFCPGMLPALCTLTWWHVVVQEAYDEDYDASIMYVEEYRPSENVHSDSGALHGVCWCGMGTGEKEGGGGGDARPVKELCEV
jgi:hypothetical protein